MSELIKKLRCWIAEMIGTMFLTMSVKLAAGFGAGLAPIGIGFTLMNMVFSFGPISGGHFNPSVTTALICRGLPGFPATDYLNVFGYYLFQILGGLLGGTFGSIIGGHRPTVNGYCFTTLPDRSQAFLAEFFFTYLLCMVVIHCATDRRLDSSDMAGPNHFFGLAIGSSVTIAAVAIGPVSGACLNFAVYVGTLVPALAMHKESEEIRDSQVWIYLLAPLLGGACAGLMYRYVFNPDLANDGEKGAAAAIQTGNGGSAGDA